MKELSIQSRHHTEFIDITAEIQSVIQELGFKEGLITIYVPHTTAAITINENADPDVVADIKAVLDNLVPWNGQYRHGEGNAAAHVKASLIGSSIQMPVENGHLKTGTWQGIYFCEFDGPRNRRVWVLPCPPCS